jgi:hypothetical protein
VIVTGKSGKRRREAWITLYDELRAVLARIPKRSPTILTNSQGRPWKRNGFSKPALSNSRTNRECVRGSRK